MNQSRYRNIERVFAYTFLSVILLLMLKTGSEIFEQGTHLKTFDSEFYSLQGQYWVHNLLPLGRVAGWFPLWLGGFDYYVMYPPLTAYVLGLMSLVFGATLPTRLFAVGVWMALIPASYTFLRSVGLSRIVAAVGASMVVALNVDLSAGFDAIFTIGFLPQALGFALSLLVVARFYRLLNREDLHPAKSVRTGFFLALLILAHHFSTLWAGCASLILLGLSCFRSPVWPNKLKNYSLAMGVGLLLSAFWWVPLLMNRHLMVNVPPLFGSVDSDMVFGDALLALSPLILSLAVIGLGYLLWTRQHRMAILLALFFLYSFFQTMGWIPFPMEVVNGVQARRFQGYVDWTILMSAAFGFRAIQYFYEKSMNSGWARAVPILLLGIFVQYQMRYASFTRNSTPDLVVRSEAGAQLDELVEWLKPRAKLGEANLSESRGELDVYGGWHFLSINLARRVPGLWDLAGGYPEAIRGAEKPFYLARRISSELPRSRDLLRRRGVRFVATMQEQTARTVMKTVPWVKKVWEPSRKNPEGKDNLALFEVTDFSTPFGLDPSIAADLASFSYAAPGRYQLDFSKRVSIPAGSTFAVNFHPWLHLSADGHPVATIAGPDWLLATGENIAQVSTVVIRYLPPMSVHVARVLSLLGWLALIFLFTAGRRFLEPPRTKT